MTPFEQASAALAESLLDDPFYRAITDDFESDVAARKQALIRYFHFSLEEADRSGRCVAAPDPGLGAAAWLLPRSPDVAAAESSAKSKYLVSVLGPRGAENYNRIIRYMGPLAAQVVPQGAWYLSVIGVLPSAQGRGLGATLLADTLAEASCLGGTCHLETFTPRSVRFYERHGFRWVADHLEPSTNRAYVFMRRDS